MDIRKSTQSSETHAGHENTDARIRPIAGFLAGLAVLVFVAMLLMAWLIDLFQFHADQHERVPAGLTDQTQLPPEPRLQAYPSVDLERLRAREERLLNSYEWVDESTGVMRIPIERSMDIVAETELPFRLNVTEEGEEEQTLR